MILIENFHEEVYDFIYNLIESDVTRNKVRNLMDTINSAFFEEKAAMKWHQTYPGGLADHTALVILDAYHSSVTKPWGFLRSDDIIVGCLLHDLEKIGKYGDFVRICEDDYKTLELAEKYGLISGDVQLCVLLIHGGWSDLRGEHPPIAVYAHAADMLASHVTKTRTLTRRKIREIMSEIIKIKAMDKELPEFCIICGTPFSNIKSIFHCETCNTKYYIRKTKLGKIKITRITDGDKIETRME